MLKKFRYWFYRLWIIDCVGCGSLVVHSRGLCLPCENVILKNYLSVQPDITKLSPAGLPFRFLYHWIPVSSDVLSRYVHLLKSPLAEPLWHELSRYYVTPKETQSQLLFVPIPSRKNRKHSLFFAQGLADKFGGNVLEALQISSPDTREQKQKSRAERQKIRFSVNEEFTDLLYQASTIVLVDDVITTGASYEAAYNVLKNRGVWPENIELWAAFYRESVKVDFE
jgi:predicted amidophosphoribosyltransferase